MGNGGRRRRGKRRGNEREKEKVDIRKCKKEKNEKVYAVHKMAERSWVEHERNG